MNAQELLDSVEVEYNQQEVVDINITKLFGVGRFQRARITGVKAHKNFGSLSHKSGEASH